MKNIDTPYVAGIISTPLMNTIYYDTIGKTYDSVFISLKEPQLVFYVINNDVSKLISFWLDDKDKNELFIDAKNVSDRSIIISKTNAKYEKYKTATSILYDNSLSKLSKMMEITTDSLRLDSLQHAHKKIWDSILYKYSLQNNNSYFSLWNLCRWLDEFNQPENRTYLSKEALRKLLNKLPKKWKKYPSYQKCLQMSEYKKRRSPTFINEPLFKM